MDIYDIPPKMLSDLAMGVRDPITIAENYGLTQAEFMSLASHPYYYQLIESKKKELGVDGLTTKIKMSHLAEVLLHDAYQAAMQCDSVLHKLEVGKYLAKLGGMEPAPGAQVAQGGGGFSISITFTHPEQKPVILEGVTEAVEVEEGEMFPERLKKPPALNILNSDVNTELSANLPEELDVQT